MPIVTDPVQYLREYILRRYHGRNVQPDVPPRALKITPVAGDYGLNAGAFIAVAGSPPKGALYVDFGRKAVFYLADRATRLPWRLFSVINDALTQLVPDIQTRIDPISF